MTTLVTISVLPDRLYYIELPAGVDAYYNDVKVGGSGTDNIFISVDGVNEIRLESSLALTDSFDLVELQISYYDIYDGQGGVWCFQSEAQKWTARYSFRPEWMSNVANRLVSFKDGKPYIHNGPYNEFYGVLYDSVIAAVMNEGAEVNTFKGIGITGSTPDSVHFRTESPNVQSSDLIKDEFRIKEGISYADILRDRLSPNVTGDVYKKLKSGDNMRGDVLKFMYIHRQPEALKSLSEIEVVFNPSSGHS
jgi:hypothetical protein